MKESEVRRIYNVEDIANYNRIVSDLPSGNTIRFDEFHAEVTDEDIAYFERLDDYQIRGYREIVYVKLTEEMFEKAPARVMLDLEGLCFGMSGFAEAMRNIIYYLHKKGFIITVFPHDEHKQEDTQITKTEKGKVIKKLSHVRYDYSKLKSPVKHISIQMTSIGGIKRRKNAYNVAFAMFETAIFPSNYIDHLNSNVDEIITPSNFNVNNILDAGWKKPIQKVSLGVDTERFYAPRYESFEPEESPIGKYKDKFIFLTIQGYSARKGIYKLYEAFLKEFNSSDNVILYCKGGWYNENTANSELQSAINNYNSTNAAPVILDFRIYPDQIHPRLYATANCFVLPSLGEGFGLNYTEAMSMGLPVIGSRSTAMLDYMDDKNSFPIEIERYAPEPLADWICNEYIGADFAVPSVDSLRKQMRYVYSHPLEAKKIGKKARNDMVLNMQWEKSANILTERIQEIVKTL